MEGLTFEQTPSAPITTPRKRSPKRFIFLLAAIVVIVIMIFAGVKLLGSSKKSQPTAEITPTPTEVITEMPTETPTATPTATTTPTSTPKPTATPTAASAANPVDSATGLDRSTLGVKVENGSGVDGAAGAASTYLKGLGYDIIGTGAAANYDFTNVTIQIKAAKAKFLPLLKTDLSAKYTVGTTSSDLDASSSADALVIIGK